MLSQLKPRTAGGIVHLKIGRMFSPEYIYLLKLGWLVLAGSILAFWYSSYTSNKNNGQQ